MTLNQAIARAKRLARRHQEVFFVVPGDFVGYDVASEDDLETFYLGSRPLYAVSEDGEVLTEEA